MNRIAPRLMFEATLLQVFDMPRSIAFYRDALGFSVVSASSPGDDCDWAMFEGGSGSAADTFWLMLNTAYEADERPTAPDPERVAAHADTTLYLECADPDEIYRSLCERGLQPQAPTTAPYGMRRVYLSDPDGFQLCFQKYVPAQGFEAPWMTTPPPPIRRVLETALYADDLDAAKTFYRDVLGLEFHSEIEGRNVFFRCGEGMLLIFRPDETRKPFGTIPSHGTDRAGHVCFSVDAATLEDWKERLVAAGVAIESEHQWGDRGKSVYFRDPAGNSLELSHPAIWGLPEG